MATIEPTPIDVTFDAPIGVEVKGDVWSCVDVPGSKELLGTGRSVRVDATVDGIPLRAVGLIPNGAGGAHALGQRKTAEAAGEGGRRHRHRPPVTTTRLSSWTSPRSGSSIIEDRLRRGPRERLPPA